jgi:hypothetical protein
MAVKTIVWRNLWTVALLVIVWLHAHWSVALAITSLSVFNELNGLLLHEVVDVIVPDGGGK